jgi:hypothetical protein
MHLDQFSSHVASLLPPFGGLPISQTPVMFVCLFFFKKKQPASMTSQHHLRCHGTILRAFKFGLTYVQIRML